MQRKDALTNASWLTLAVTPNRSVKVPAGGEAGFFRIAEAPGEAGVTLSATLSGAAERPTPVTTTATGSAALVLDGDTLHIYVTYEGLSSDAKNAHIHGPAAADGTASPMINLVPLSQGTLATSGVFAGSVTVTAAQKTALLDGMTYVNIHSAQFAGGEIRGQVQVSP